MGLSIEGSDVSCRQFYFSLQVRGSHYIFCRGTKELSFTMGYFFKESGTFGTRRNKQNRNQGRDSENY